MASSEFSVESADVIRLIEAHLTENGLHQSCQALIAESNIKAAGSSHSNWRIWATKGDWGQILPSLSGLDTQRCQIPLDLLADVHEMAILELAENGDMELAFCTLRLVADDLDKADKTPPSDLHIPKSRLTEQRLNSLAASRASNRTAPPPTDFYGSSSKQSRRDDIARRLTDTIPKVPASRLTALLQQAIKWQAHTGELPMIRDQWDDDEESGNKRKRKRRHFDLVLGETSLSQAIDAGVSQEEVDDIVSEPIPSKPYSTLSFGKKATAECALFLQDGSGLITGSSDGLIEVWDPNQKYKELRMDLPYQQKEELLGHDVAITALAVSNDLALLATGDQSGELKVWRLDSGKCLRSLSAHSGYTVSDITFSNDASHVLTASHDTTCREFGLRNARMLKEFRGHASFVNACTYILADEESKLRVVTSSADGTARVWDGRSAEVLHILRPLSLGTAPSAAGTSIIQQVDSPSDGNSPNLHSLIPLHTPAQTIILVPRGNRAFLVTLKGMVLRTFELDSPTKVFVAATVSPSNTWLYGVTDDGDCHVFRVATGESKTFIRHFGQESVDKSKAESEITAILHHPRRGIVAAFANDKSQKKGKLTLWK